MKPTTETPASGPSHAAKPHAGGIRPSIYLIAFIAATGGFIFGFDMMVMSGSILFLESHFELDAKMRGYAMISANWGVLAGLVGAGWMSDRFGRKTTLILATILFALSALGTALPRTYEAWYVFRVLGGIGGGLAAIVSPMYIAEISPAAFRGRLVLLYQIAIVVSAVVAALTTYLLARYIELPEMSWRLMFGSEMVPILLLGIALPFIPESPRWLVLKDRTDKAVEVLRRVDPDQDIDAEIRIIRESFHEHAGRYLDLLKRPYVMAMVVAGGLAALQQLTGVSTLTFYAPTIFMEAGLADSADAIGLSIFPTIWVLICTLVAFYLVDRWGRRPLLLWGTLGMAVGQVAMGIVFLMDLSPYVAMIVMLFGQAAYVTSLAPLSWLIMAEIFPSHLRAKGMAVASLLMQFSAMGVNAMFSDWLASSTARFGSPAIVFWGFACVCVLAWLFCYKLVPETKGRMLEEIAAHWDRKNHVTK